VGQLVQIRDREAELLCNSRCLSPEKIVFVVGDAAYIFHCAEVVLGHEDLVVFTERVRFSEEALVEVHARLSDVEHQFVVN